MPKPCSLPKIFDILLKKKKKYLLIADFFKNFERQKITYLRFNMTFDVNI